MAEARYPKVVSSPPLVPSRVIESILAACLFLSIISAPLGLGLDPSNYVTIVNMEGWQWVPFTFAPVEGMGTAYDEIVICHKGGTMRLSINGNAFTLPNKLDEAKEFRNTTNHWNATWGSRLANINFGCNPGWQYYIDFVVLRNSETGREIVLSDGSNTSLWGPRARGVRIFSMGTDIVDDSPPFIVHVPVTKWSNKEKPRIIARVEDASQVVCYVAWRQTTGWEDFDSTKFAMPRVPMFRVLDDYYLAELPLQESGSRISYYISATDAYGNTARWPNDDLWGGGGGDCWQFEVYEEGDGTFQLTMNIVVDLNTKIDVEPAVNVDVQRRRAYERSWFLVFHDTWSTSLNQILEDAPPDLPVAIALVTGTDLIRRGGRVVAFIVDSLERFSGENGRIEIIDHTYLHDTSGEYSYDALQLDASILTMLEYLNSTFPLGYLGPGWSVKPLEDGAMTDRLGHPYTYYVTGRKYEVYDLPASPTGRSSRRMVGIPGLVMHMDTEYPTDVYGLPAGSPPSWLNISVVKAKLQELLEDESVEIIGHMCHLTSGDVTREVEICRDYLNWVWKEYGPDGSDTIWFATPSEIAKQYYDRDVALQSYDFSLEGNSLRVVVNLKEGVSDLVFKIGPGVSSLSEVRVYGLRSGRCESWLQDGYGYVSFSTKGLIAGLPEGLESLTVLACISLFVAMVTRSNRNGGDRTETRVAR